jgi:hypothetical protein
MKISTYAKIDKQVESYMARTMPSIEWLIPDHRKLENKMANIRDKFQPAIHKFCEDMRKEKSTEKCFCKLHPTHEKYQELIGPVIIQVELQRDEYRKLRNAHRDAYEKILIQVKHAKECYASKCF